MRSTAAFKNGHFPVHSFTDLLPLTWAWHHPELFTTGLPFSLTLASILLTYRLARMGVQRLVSARNSSSAIHRGSNFAPLNPRTALLATGASGPLAGFLVVMCTTGIGLLHSTSIPPESRPSPVHLAPPAAIAILRNVMLASYPDIPSLSRLLPSPVLLASWAGLVLLFVDLLPAGRLSGGRVLYALSPRLHRTCSNLVIGALFYFGVVEWAGWLVIVFLLLQPGMKQPRLPSQAPPAVEWLALVPLYLAVLVLTATTQPVSGMSLTQILIHPR